MGADIGAPTDDEHIQAATGGTAGIPADIVTSTTAASNLPASVFQTVAAVRGEIGSGNPITLDSGDTMTVTVQSSNSDTATSQITFYGAITGGTVPATPTFS